MKLKIRQHIPNTVTCCNLLCGCIATMTALHGCQAIAFAWILAGGIFDFFDGLTARALHTTSPIGKELDSLADEITFGLAPSTMVFMLIKSGIPNIPITSAIGNVLPYVAFIMVAFSALRLAKFNLDTRQATSFIGLPTPANALFWGGLCVGAHDILSESPGGMLAVLALVIVMSVLLVAEIPMFSLKFHRGSRNDIAIIFVGISAIVITSAWISRGILWALSSFAVVIGLYIILSICSRLFQHNKQ